jgi:ribonuclease P/MRP protein subunit RPP1
MDVVNLACVWGLSHERGKEAICEEARKVVALSSLKRTSWRGVVDVVDGGEKQGPKKVDDASKKKAEQTFTILEKNGENLKRKASLESAQDDQKPLSKREMKRRAKKARFEAHVQS